MIYIFFWGGEGWMYGSHGHSDILEISGVIFKNLRASWQHNMEHKEPLMSSKQQ